MSAAWLRRRCVASSLLRFCLHRQPIIFRNKQLTIKVQTYFSLFLLLAADLNIFLDSIFADMISTFTLYFPAFSSFFTPCVYFLLRCSEAPQRLASKFTRSTSEAALFFTTAFSRRAQLIFWVAGKSNILSYLVWIAQEKLFDPFEHVFCDRRNTLACLAYKVVNQFCLRAMHVRSCKKAWNHTYRKIFNGG